MSKSTRSRPKNKPAKPYPDYPLTPHPSGRWCKKIRGRMFYFGPWHDTQGALSRYLEQRDDLHAGRVPAAASANGLSVRELCNRFLTSKKHKLETGQLSPQSFGDYH